MYLGKYTKRLFIFNFNSGRDRNSTSELKVSTVLCALFKSRFYFIRIIHILDRIVLLVVLIRIGRRYTYHVLLLDEPNTIDLIDSLNICAKFLLLFCIEIKRLQA